MRRKMLIITFAILMRIYSSINYTNLNWKMMFAIFLIKNNCVLFTNQSLMLNQKITGFEALVRWADPERGIVSPDQFIPALEKQGLMPRLTEWVMSTAVEQLMKWRSEGRVYIMHVNITARDVENPHFVKWVGGLLAKHQLPSEQLMLELTESTLMKIWEKGGKLLRKLRSLGVKLAIDDFGTGYSSLSYLNRFPVDKLKIDRSFINDWLQQKDERLIGAIISLSRAMGFGVVAEGVEQQIQLDFLSALGVTSSRAICTANLCHLPKLHLPSGF